MRICVETDIRRHVADARPYAGCVTPFGTSSAMQWSLKDAGTTNGAKVRPLGLGGSTG
jgi:hypothetical protein